MVTGSRWLKGRFIAMFALGACGGNPTLDLRIVDPCNQAVLSDDNLNRSIGFIELELDSSHYDQPKQTRWKNSDAKGDFPEIEAAPDVVVRVRSRGVNTSGEPSVTLAAGGFGPVDFGGIGDDDLRLRIAQGRVGTFYRTTDLEAAARGETLCSPHDAPRRFHTATRLRDGTVLLVGGSRPVTGGSTQYWSTAELYLPSSGEFVTGPDIDWERVGHTATPLPDGRVLLVGGQAVMPGGTPVYWGLAQVYDPVTNTFLSPFELKVQRTNHTATLLGDGRVLVAGGEDEAGAHGSTEIVDPAAQTSVWGANLSEARAHHGAVAISDTAVAIIGGVGLGQVRDSIDIVTVEGSSFGLTTLSSTLSTPRSHGMVIHLPSADAIIVAGGFTSTVANVETGTGNNSFDVIRYDADNLSLSAVGCPGLSLLERRALSAAAALSSSEVLLVGGLGTGGLPSETAEVIRINEMTSCDVTSAYTTATLATSLAGAVATPLYGGDVLISGGWTENSGQVAASAFGEIYAAKR